MERAAAPPLLRAPCRGRPLGTHGAVAGEASGGHSYTMNSKKARSNFNELHRPQIFQLRLA
eukprot:scaffold6554_cov28-Tisochrysis_lutea.AAC.1